jgi:predicted dehydrogenase
VVFWHQDWHIHMNTHPHPPAPQDLGLSRRRFLGRSFALAAVSVVPAHVLGRGAEAPPSRKLNLACIGVGGRGKDNLNSLLGENIVGLCDVDPARAAEALKLAPGAKLFQDFREMLDQLDKQIDAVVVSTPDHTHAVAAMLALEKRKPVYCEKPLAHSLFEVRRLSEFARARRVPTQLGNQGHATDSIRQFVEMIQGGAIGTVREVHAWCQNSYRPREFRVRPTATPPIPPTLVWDQWLGPAPLRPYHPTYLPGRWRGWVDFGTGILGDWNCHVLDPVFWALDLGAPTSVQAQAEEYADPAVRAETFPAVSTIDFDFPARGARPAVKVRWFTGTLPPRPEELEPDRKLVNIGAIVIGDQGKIMYGSHGAAGAQLLPAVKDQAFVRPPKTIPRSKGHHEEWLEACRGGAPAGSNFDYGGPLTEVALLGVLALRFNGQKLDWDSPALAVTNVPEANRFVNPPYRHGWHLQRPL